MKKLLVLLLGMMTVLSMATALAELTEKSIHSETGTDALDGNQAEYTYLAFTWGYTGDGPLGTPSDMTDTSRVIQMLMPGTAMPVAMLLPDDCGAPEDYSFKGVTITVDTPICVERDGPYVTVIDLPDFIVPRHIEIVGDVFYGCLAEVEKDYVTLDIYEDFVANSTNKIRRFTVTENTLIFLIDEPQLKPWEGAIIIGSPDGEALAIHLSRG